MDIKQQGLGPSFLHTLSTTYDNEAQTDSNLTSPANPAGFRRPGIGGRLPLWIALSPFPPLSQENNGMLRELFLSSPVLLVSLPTHGTMEPLLWARYLASWAVIASRSDPSPVLQLTQSFTPKEWPLSSHCVALYLASTQLP